MHRPINPNQSNSFLCLASRKSGWLCKYVTLIPIQLLNQCSGVNIRDHSRTKSLTHFNEYWKILLPFNQLKYIGVVGLFHKNNAESVLAYYMYRAIITYHKLHVHCTVYNISHENIVTTAQETDIVCERERNKRRNIKHFFIAVLCDNAVFIDWQGLGLLFLRRQIVRSIF